MEALAVTHLRKAIRHIHNVNLSTTVTALCLVVGVKRTYLEREDGVRRLSVFIA